MSDDLPANDNAQGPAPASEAASPPAVGHIAAGGGLLAMIERLASNPQLDINVFDRLLAARREEEDRAAERAFNAALSLAKGELEPILKTRDVDFPSKDPSKARTKYKYEELADIARVVDPVFQKHGLSYRYSVKQDGNQVEVRCILAHADGHSVESLPLRGSTEIPAGSNMNPLQALGSALTYLQRYSLRAAIGLAAGRDDDARSLTPASPPVNAEQITEMEDLIAETGSSQITLLRLIGCESVAEMTVDQWTRAKEVLGLRRAEKQRLRGNANVAAGDV